MSAGNMVGRVRRHRSVSSSVSVARTGHGRRRQIHDSSHDSDYRRRYRDCRTPDEEIKRDYEFYSERDDYRLGRVSRNEERGSKGRCSRCADTIVCDRNDLETVMREVIRKEISLSIRNELEQNSGQLPKELGKRLESVESSVNKLEEQCSSFCTEVRGMINMLQGIPSAGPMELSSLKRVVEGVVGTKSWSSIVCPHQEQLNVKSSDINNNRHGRSSSPMSLSSARNQKEPLSLILKPSPSQQQDGDTKKKFKTLIREEALKSEHKEAILQTIDGAMQSGCVMPWKELAEEIVDLAAATWSTNILVFILRLNISSRSGREKFFQGFWEHYKIALRNTMHDPQGCICKLPHLHPIFGKTPCNGNHAGFFCALLLNIPPSVNHLDDFLTILQCDDCLPPKEFISKVLYVLAYAKERNVFEKISTLVIAHSRRPRPRMTSENVRSYSSLPKKTRKAIECLDSIYKDKSASNSFRTMMMNNELTNEILSIVVQHIAQLIRRPGFAAPIGELLTWNECQVLQTKLFEHYQLNPFISQATPDCFELSSAAEFFSRVIVPLEDPTLSTDAMTSWLDVLTDFNQPLETRAFLWMLAFFMKNQEKTIEQYLSRIADHTVTWKLKKCSVAAFPNF